MASEVNDVDSTANANTPGAMMSIDRPGPRSTIDAARVPMISKINGITRANNICSALRIKSLNSIRVCADTIVQNRDAAGLGVKFRLIAETCPSAPGTHPPTSDVRPESIRATHPSTRTMMSMWPGDPERHRPKRDRIREPIHRRPYRAVMPPAIRSVLDPARPKTGPYYLSPRP